MSGGHFNYGCFRISQFADELKHEIDTNDDESTNEYGETIGEGLSPETIQRVTKAHKTIELAGKLAREIEWLYSGDHGEESFCRLVDEIFNELT
ncbi:MAG TPA: hypothetical protein DCS09_04745 [Porphyromonadaceae bacterium]|nr:hypothetical protein [Porphyromonadaceae bacterium]